MKLTVSRTYHDLVPKLSTGDQKQLHDSIKKEGFWDHMPILVNPEGIILDGHHRFKICNELNIKPSVKIVEFENPEVEEPLFILNNTLKRRQLTPMQRIEIAKHAQKYFLKLGKERMSIGGRLKSGKEGIQKSGDPHRTDKAIASLADTSHDTVHKANVILAKGTEEQKDKVRSGKTSINHTYNSIINKDRHTETPALPKGTYDIIYADPPWEYRNGGRGSATNHYSTMPLNEICDLKVPSANNAMLFLWTTASNLEAGLQVVAEWGFKYMTAMAWVKTKMGTGFYVRSKFEILLIAKKGEMPLPLEDARPPNVFIIHESEHSKKPEQFYKVIEEMYPNRKYLELFARNTRKGWKSWGNEITEQEK